MIKKELNTSCGKRLKECLNDSHMTQKELSKRTSYSQQYISYVISGKRNASAEALISFAKVLNVRNEYLLCEDDYKTSEDIQKALRLSDKKNIECVLQYLDSIGYSLYIQYTVQSEITTLYFHFDEIKKYIIPRDLKRLNEKYDFSLPMIDFVKSTSERGIGYETFCVTQDFPGIYERLDSRSKSARINSQTFYFEDSGKGYVYTINTVYSLYKDGKCIRYVSHKELLRFLDILDNYVKCTIENVLLNQRISPLDKDDILIEQETMLKTVIINHSDDYNYQLLKNITGQISTDERPYDFGNEAPSLYLHDESE